MATFVWADKIHIFATIPWIFFSEGSQEYPLIFIYQLLTILFMPSDVCINFKIGELIPKGRCVIQLTQGPLIWK